MIDKDLDHLDPALKPLAVQFFHKCHDSEIKAFPSETYRPGAREDELHAKGITRATSKTCEHCHTLPDGTPASRAFDFLIEDVDGSIIENGSDAAYHLAGQIAEDLGLVWGGRFKVPDFDHVQLS